MDNLQYTLQVAMEDCTGCALCVEVCPAKNKRAVGRKAINMEPQLPLRDQGRANWDFFLELPDYPRNGHNENGTVTVDPVPDSYGSLEFKNVKNVQLLEPLFEFSGACAGCGETPYLSLLSRLFGDHTIVANATGCSSIYGGNLPTTPWAVNKDGRGPPGNSSLFEDNAEFGLGMSLTREKQNSYAQELVRYLRGIIGEDLADGLISADQSDEHGLDEQRKRISQLKDKLTALAERQHKQRNVGRSATW
ncbi:MAG: 4Fe-4S binding protein [Caldilineaceae bacterium]